MSRVKDDPSLIDELGIHANDDPVFIHNPIFIVQQMADGRQNFMLHIGAVDPMGQTPAIMGIILSDLLDHIAAAYHQLSGADEKAVREYIARSMRKEDKFKERDPNRGIQRGATLKPKAH